VTAEPGKIDRKERKYVPDQVVEAIRLTTDKGDIEVAGKPEISGSSSTWSIRRRKQAGFVPPAIPVYM
jgi:hypothetical protein